MQTVCRHYQYTLDVIISSITIALCLHHKVKFFASRFHHKILTIYDRDKKLLKIPHNRIAVVNILQCYKEIFLILVSARVGERGKSLAAIIYTL